MGSGVLRGDELFQSTHPRGVRHGGVDLSPQSIMISIHAPARGATPMGLSFGVTIHHFNPRTREGCDEQLCIWHWRCFYFNPRTREGCDFCFITSFFEWRNFNPRTREGCDFKTRYLCFAISVFQSTHPRGVRLYNATRKNRR